MQRAKRTRPTVLLDAHPSNARGTPVTVAAFQARQAENFPPNLGRAKALRAPPPLGNELLAIFNRVRVLEDDTTRAELENRYEIGELILGVERDARYGDRGVERLALALGHHKATLYRAARIFEYWPAAAFHDVTARKGREGHRITWSHLEQLVTVSDEARRRELTERVLAEKLSVKDLRRELRPTPVRGNESARRPHQRGVREISAAAAVAQDRLERAGGVLGEMPMAATDPADILDAIDSLGSLAITVSDLQKRLGSAKAAARNDRCVLGTQPVGAPPRAGLLGRHNNPPASSAPAVKGDPR